MKRVLILTVGLFFLLFCFSESFAWFGSKKKETKTEKTQALVESEDVARVSKKEAVKEVVVEPKKSDKAMEEELKVKRAEVEKKRRELNNTEWQIELTPLSGKGKKESEDIVFKDNQITILGFAKKGFPTTNYTLTIQEDSMIVWETMQTSKESGIAFWRGEMDKGMQNIRGILSHQIDEKTKQDYSFVSINRKNIPVSGN